MDKVLFICVHNSARSQMAEAYLDLFGNGEFEAQSAGFEPTSINPLVVEVMREEGVDLSSKGVQSAFDLFRQGRVFSYVITVCSDADEAQCPIYPGLVRRLHIPFADPSKLEGTREEKLAQLRGIRDQIREAVKGFVAWVRAGGEGDLMHHIRQ
ncbi:MAG: arsenate reductase ArsC [Pseudodesulfovibrio sp.]|uniref:Protein-tyrosine phosphatase, low molecular weight n=2 Tax=Pseudodesulfovibrio TaxID=2035811 RepID=E6VT65_PSEA9|nr:MULTISPECIES: arsenate reductase ArsC [Pseudodesulfovibrio]MBU4192825.1 arsenate reductase ArsC [Pseudomonadota bacterium]ADU62115.1 Protein-tyrosine phosphatase, low molecular weight [Pseudodesulfovibrio aespoeensis Aspo-2]MBU4244334.1 arsenate reductase ArsC [Pseudomonadota bacterium]MBU4378807.1 arsenate reductase ArsC [Pseudomonadota bacterium]MBU4476561.1 arsenate reductase ArsC [Pseudomonadota bacterium]